MEKTLVKTATTTNWMVDLSVLTRLGFTVETRQISEEYKPLLGGPKPAKYELKIFVRGDEELAECTPDEESADC